AVWRPASRCDANWCDLFRRLAQHAGISRSRSCTIDRGCLLQRSAELRLAARPDSQLPLLRHLSASDPRLPAERGYAPTCVVAADDGLVGEQPWRLCHRLDPARDRYRCHRARPLARLAGLQPDAPSTIANLS